jgi:hypothetical protein
MDRSKDHSRSCTVVDIGDQILTNAYAELLGWSVKEVEDYIRQAVLAVLKVAYVTSKTP